MKNIRIYITLVSIALLFSCSNDDNGGGTIPITSQNGAPAIPDLVFPANNLTCTNFNLEFDWNTVTDPDGDEVNYIIEIATDNNFTTVLFTAVTSETIRTFNLEKGITYFWRVKARDTNDNESEYSETQSFFTEPDASIDILPSTPQLIGPTIGARVSGSTISLDWETTDVDRDTILYDIYFGDTNPPTLFSEGKEISILDVAISPNTVYYWQVVIKDNNQNASIGQVWNFRTE
ncbi:fibronectin type III domain-containing protein [Aquimarina pacifica]|uniref:hypothetical protein n=1 Tax=Aquimarina pacifica TaxID=1296415 RepID=UPI000472B715|nr:hypothetical protein [Aquimarina pacifica]